MVRDLPSRVRELKRMGFRIPIDDLGTGYAGLSACTELEPNVKLDMSLVRRVWCRLDKAEHHQAAGADV
jgi:EAL domain-containing protein (putative c-di-GMP-specific phosphodiesterase class I)